MKKLLTVLVFLAMFLSVIYALFIYEPTPDPANMVISRKSIQLLTDSVGWFAIANTGDMLLKWTLYSEQTWLEASPKFGWQYRHDLDSIQVTVSRAGLENGLHQGRIFIESNAGADTVWVDLYVNVNNKLSVTPDSLKLSAIQGNLAHDKLIIYNEMPATIRWNAVAMADWLGLGQYYGITPDTIGVTASAEAIAPGVYQSEIFVMSGLGLPGEKKAIPVKFTVTARPDVHQYFKYDVEKICENPGWKKVAINRKDGLEAAVSSVSAPKDDYRLDFKFYSVKPETVFVFGEVFVDNSDKSDSFWFAFNGKTYQWKNMNAFLDKEWGRAWAPFNRRFGFVTVAGENVVSLYPRGIGTDINWLVVTTNPVLDIEKYEF